MAKLRRPASAVFQWAVTAAGFACLAAASVPRPYLPAVWPALFFVLLAVLAETQTAETHGGQALSVSPAVDLAALLVCGGPAAVWAGAASVLGTLMRTEEKGWRHVFNIPPALTLFNGCGYALSTGAMWGVYAALGGHTLVPASAGGVLRQLGSAAAPSAAGLAAAVALNVLINSSFFALRRGEKLSAVLSGALPWAAPGFVAVGLLGAVLAGLYLCRGWGTVLLFLLPLLLARAVFLLYRSQRETYLQTVQSLAAAIEAKDAYTLGHSRRVEAYCALMARELGFSRSRSETLRFGALLHDIGKIGIGEAILNKPGDLTDDEYRLIRSHPEKGERIVADVVFLRRPARLIRWHHERFDGRGYPDGLRAADLPLEVRVLTVADSYDAMTSARPYRDALTRGEAMEQLYKGAGSQFDPTVVAAFDRALSRTAKGAGRSFGMKTIRSEI